MYSNWFASDNNYYDLKRDGKSVAKGGGGQEGGPVYLYTHLSPDSPLKIKKLEKIINHISGMFHAKVRKQ